VERVAAPSALDVILSREDGEETADLKRPCSLAAVMPG
jgi:hypothetical protein